MRACDSLVRRVCRERESRGVLSTGTVGGSLGGELRACPCCERRFGPNSYDRHVQVCKAKSASRPTFSR